MVNNSLGSVDNLSELVDNPFDFANNPSELVVGIQPYFVDTVDHPCMAVVVDWDKYLKMEENILVLMLVVAVLPVQ